ncbi:MAG: pilus assembly PilX N-terminal domain-containing protein [Acidobacteria bacterium]|nr:pilus assembly PilX N-terminal domain-containing protein [Acidobacteriota bacterium]
MIEMNQNSKRFRTDERGSALLVTLMVMVGLSMLGLGFVAISETESAISVNQRNYAHTLSVAESGARAVVEMFQDANWAASLGILPPNNAAIKTQRPSIGYYKSSPTQLLFDSPFKPSPNDRFYGNFENADIIINDSKGTTAQNYLATLNTMLFGTTSDTRLTELRIFAPPVVDGVLTNGFWVGGSRFGVATVSATAERRTEWPSGRPLARRTVKIVVGETPLPGATGPIQTEGALVSAGNFEVYWGKITSVESMKVARPAVGLPWVDATRHVNYEHGYDSTHPWTANKAYTLGERMHARQVDWDADPELRKFAYAALAAQNSGATPPATTDYPKTIGNDFTDPAGNLWRTTASAGFPIKPAEPLASYDWLYELVGKTIEDPWFHARSRQNLTYGNNNQATPNGPHPFKYSNPAQNEQTLYSNFFKEQTKTFPYDHVEVTFPTMDYDFWKEIAQSAEPDSGIIYLRYVAAKNEFISLDNVSKPATWWLNTMQLNTMQNGYGPGFYFFDTKNGLNPQFEKGGELTPGININAQVGGPFQMQGFIYLNAEFFGSTGQGDIVPDDVYPMPGEPFRDVGYRKVDPDTNAFELDAGDYVIGGRDSGIWDFQDLNDNYQFDLVVEQKTITKPGDGATVTVWLPVPFFEGCTDYVNQCSEPHEPYLNFIYPTVGNEEGAITIGWQDPNTQTRRPKIRTGQNTSVSCTSTSSAIDCTSNKHDEDGALVTLDPLLNGILYNEGGYEGAGNATYYGSLLIRDYVDVTGTPRVFFNECILRGCWQEMLNLPKVRLQAVSTDQ